jgi:GntR family transcriptional repressor for pyruvate dehydrogenase complex
MTEPTLPAMRPLARKSTADECADRLRLAILRGDHPPGTRLPPERELAEALGVNRMTLRAALARLGQEGLLATRQGSGHKVRDFLDSGGLALVPAVLEAMQEPRARMGALADLLATRRALASVVLTRAASTLDALEPGKRDLAVAELKTAIAELQRRADARLGLDAVSAADQLIVAALVRLTGSSVLPLFMNPVAALLAGLDDLRATLYAEPIENVRGWQAVVVWLTSARRPPLETIDALMMARDDKTLTRVGRPGDSKKVRDAK